jgi:hypothetical protein
MKPTLSLLKYVKAEVSARVAMIRKAAYLPSHLNNIMIGVLLGDAGCYRTTKSLSSNSRLEFSFGQHRALFAG